MRQTTSDSMRPLLMDSDKASAQGGPLEVRALETVIGSLPRSLGWRISNLLIQRRIVDASRRCSPRASTLSA